VIILDHICLVRCDGSDIYPLLICTCPHPRSTKAAVLIAASASLILFPFPIVSVHFPSGLSFYGFWRGTLVSCLFPVYSTDPHRLHAALFAIFLVYFDIFLFTTRIISTLYNVPLPSSPIASQRNIRGPPLLTIHPPRTWWKCLGGGGEVQTDVRERFSDKESLLRIYEYTSPPLISVRIDT